MTYVVSTSKNAIQHLKLCRHGKISMSYSEEKGKLRYSVHSVIFSKIKRI